jgi:hypothetical protein
MNAGGGLNPKPFSGVQPTLSQESDHPAQRTISHLDLISNQGPASLVDDPNYSHPLIGSRK